MSVPKKLVDRVKEMIETGELDYNSVSAFIQDAVRRRLEELEKIRMVGEEYELSEEDVKRMAKMEHVNVAVVNGGKTVIAVKDHTDGRIYDVFLSQGSRGIVRIFCDGDKSFDCAHVKYVRYVIIPKLNELLEYYRRRKKKELSKL